MWCAFCKCQVEAEVDEANGFTCCTTCGRVLDDSVFSSDPTFLKTATGASQVEGNFVPESGVAPTLTRGPRGAVTLSFQSQDSHEKTLNRGRSEINELADRLSIRPREDIAASAHRLYKLAVQRNFTRGRRTQQVAAACLYTICRQEQKPYMLIDFSDCIQANVYLLGAVFLQLIQLLRLESHPIISRPIDPSLYIHRFADRMNFGKSMHAVANTALRLVASMKRDWMQTGRRPAGICGAALFIASHMHGFRRKKSDIVSVVHVCEATIKKRLGEFECTPSAQLTSSEFEKWGQQYEKDLAIETNNSLPILSIASGAKQDLAEVMTLCGGLSGGQDPPAFKRSMDQQQALLTAAGEKKAAADAAGAAAAVPQLEYHTNDAAEIAKTLEVADREREKRRLAADDMDEIDDDEIDQYLHTSDEVEFKEMLWKQMNQEYLLSQPENDIHSDLNASTAGGRKEGSGRSRKKKTKAVAEDKYSADTASEATHKMLSTKRLSSKINYSALQELFDEVPAEARGKENQQQAQEGEGEGAAAKSGSKRQSEKEGPSVAPEKDATGPAAAAAADGDGGHDVEDRFFDSGIGLGLGMSLGETLNQRGKKKKVRFS
mmetsp:Transcript_2661/g.6272  ORF Transcript_2661/g.6272 Transcript_2661/m.6272 type:complete len:605 (+) Transcript_2661:254-2068(+)